MSEGQQTRERWAEDEDWPDIQATLTGEPAAYARLINRYRRQIIAQMWRFADNGQALEELVQDVLVEVYLSLGGFRGDGHFGNWLRCVATRIGYRHWKKRADAQRERVCALEWHTLLSAWRTDLPLSEAAERLPQLMAKLSPEDRRVLRLKYFEGLTARDIAERVGWSEVLVRVRAHRARRRLRALLENKNDHEPPDPLSGGKGGVAL